MDQLVRFAFATGQRQPPPGQDPRVNHLHRLDWRNAHDHPKDTMRASSKYKPRRRAGQGSGSY
jgi:hypothetical protein